MLLSHDWQLSLLVFETGWSSWVVVWYADVYAVLDFENRGSHSREVAVDREGSIDIDIFVLARWRGVADSSWCVTLGRAGTLG